MAKRGKAPGARRPPARFEDSALLRSAETLGRMIGALQRQLEGATKRMGRSIPADEPSPAPLNRVNGHRTMVVRRKASNSGASTKATTRAARSIAASARPLAARAKKTAAKK